MEDKAVLQSRQLVRASSEICDKGYMNAKCLFTWASSATSASMGKESGGNGHVKNHSGVGEHTSGALPVNNSLEQCSFLNELMDSSLRL